MLESTHRGRAACLMIRMLTVVNIFLYDELLSIWHMTVSRVTYDVVILTADWLMDGRTDGRTFFCARACMKTATTTTAMTTLNYVCARVFGVFVRVCVQEDVFIVEHPELQDGSPQPWPMQVVASHVRDFVNKHGVKTVNHCSVLYYTAQYHCTFSCGGGGGRGGYLEESYAQVFFNDPSF